MIHFTKVSQIARDLNAKTRGILIVDCFFFVFVFRPSEIIMVLSQQEHFWSLFCQWDMAGRELRR